MMLVQPCARHRAMNALAAHAAGPEERAPSVCGTCGAQQNGPLQPSAVIAHAALERDRMAIDAYYTILRSGRGEWIELMHYAPLASQHHMSTYSLLKFGVLGAPYAYVPLSLQQPLVLDAILGRQRDSERNDWCMRIAKSIEVQRKCTCETECICSTGKSKDSAGPSKTNAPTSPEHATKSATGESPRSRRSRHGENSGLTSSALKDDLRATAQAALQGAAPTEYAAPVLSKTTAARATLAPPSPEVLPILEATAASGALLAPLSISTPVASHASPPPPQPPPPSTIKTSSTHPIQISSIIPLHAIVSLSYRIMEALPPPVAKLVRPVEDQEKRAYVVNGVPIPRSEVAKQIEALIADPSAHMHRQLSGEQLIRLPHVVDLGHIVDQSDSHNDLVEAVKAAVGNLLLSSCPGKKVRLDGPLHGRATVCRSLRADLERFREIDVRAIVCCLDDNELNMLGSPYNEYEHEIEALGFDLLRLPIAEGFAPIDIARFDSLISTIVFNYTLRGASVLVHCRGGVGRAGLVACAWIFKMGLVSRATQGRKYPASTCCCQADVLDIVLRLIEIVRKRRSPKAIETAEQVRFLGDYVTFLLEQEHAQRCVADCATRSR